MCAYEETGKGKGVNRVEGGVGVLWGDVQNGIKDSVGGYRVYVTEMIMGGSFFVNVEPFYGVKVWAFLMELQNMHDGAKGMHVVI